MIFWGATRNDLFYIWQHEFSLKIWVTLLEKQNIEQKFPHCLLPLTTQSTHCSCEYDIWALSKKALPAILFSISESWEHAVFTHYIASCTNWSRLRPESNCLLLVWAKIFQCCHLLSIFLVLGELFWSLSILNKFNVFCSDRLKSGWQSIFRWVFKTEFELSFKNSEKDRQFTFKYAL